MTTHLPAQAQAVIAYLQHRRGVAIPFAEICDHLWPEDKRGLGERLAQLHQLVHLARQAHPAGSISTAPGFGYAWTARP